MGTAVGALRWPDELAGLPLHPLFVHAVVVLVPLTALGTLVMASSGARSKRYSPAVVLVAVLGAVTAFLGRWSGTQVRADAGPSQSQHYEFGQYLPWLVLALLVMVGLMAVMDQQSGGKRNSVGSVFALLCALVALAATALTVVTGYTGTGLVWG